MQNILVATDMSDRSRNAILRAIMIARRFHAKLQVICVMDGDHPLTIGEDQRKETEKLIASQVSEFDESFLAKTDISAVFGYPDTEILNAARDMDADLVVMGQHRHRGVSEFFSDTVVNKVSIRSHTSVLIVGRPPAGEYSSAVVGVDFSKCAVRAIEVSTKIVGQDNLHLVHAYHRGKHATLRQTGQLEGTEDTGNAATQAELRRKIAVWVEETHLGLDPRDIVLKEGGAADVLPQMAFDLNCELICLGAHNRSWLANQFLGSTALDLLSNTQSEKVQYRDVDVLVVPL